MPVDNIFPRLIFGCEQLGGHNWGNYCPKTVVDTIHKALELGLNTYDTADVYGNGNSEKLLGNALAQKRKEAKIITKFGVYIDNKGVRRDNNNPEYIESTIINSLKRLKTDYIDYYQLHSWDKQTPVDDIIYKLIKLKEKGLILGFGQSNLPKNQIINNKFKFNYSSYEFSLANRTNESLLIKDLSNHPIFIYGGLGQGILSGKYDAEHVFPKNDRRSSKRYINFHGKKLVENLKIVEKLKKLSTKYNKTPSQIALKYIYQKSKFFSIIVGIKNQYQLDLNFDITQNWTINHKDLLFLEL